MGRFISYFQLTFFVYAFLLEDWCIMKCGLCFDKNGGNTLFILSFRIEQESDPGQTWKSRSRKGGATDFAQLC